MPSFDKSADNSGSETEDEVCEAAVFSPSDTSMWPSGTISQQKRPHETATKVDASASLSTLGASGKRRRTGRDRSYVRSQTINQAPGSKCSRKGATTMAAGDAAQSARSQGIIPAVILHVVHRG